MDNSVPFVAKVEVERRIAAIGRGQRGVIHRRQLIEAGLNLRAIARKAAAGVLVECLPGVYLLPSVPETWEQKVTAALLWSGDGVASHRSAARLWKLIDEGGVRVDITVSRRMRSPARWLFVHQVPEFPNRDRRSVSGLAVTSPERTLLDLGASVGEADLEEALEASIRLGLTTFKRVASYHRVHGGYGRRGSRALGRLLAQRGDQPCTGSPFETRLNRLLRRAKLPLPTRQHPVFDGKEFITRVDFAYPGAHTVIEADGWKHHFGRRAWQNDGTKGTDLNVLGWKVLRITYEDLCKRPQWVVDRIRKALGEQLFD